jgi:ubiquinone/menaquinone biosynthesis C-methylase UbiE
VALEERTMAGLMPELPGRRVADIAAGTGRWAAYCAARGAQAVTVDFCEEMLSGGRGTRVQADARSLPFPAGSFDVTICALALGYAPECFRELVRITRRGGCLLVSDVHPEAQRRGWIRSFRIADEVIEVSNKPYRIEELQDPEIQLQQLMEPALGSSAREMFLQAGKPELFTRACAHPAIFVAKWVRL